MTMLRTVLQRLAHLVGVHRYTVFTVVDPLQNAYRGRCCRLCGTIDEDAWQFLGSRRARRESQLLAPPRF